MSAVMEVIGIIKSRTVVNAAGVARTAAVVVLSLASFAAVAGRDAGQIMLQEKANKEVAQKRAEIDFAPGAGATMQKIVLPLDHGPRAVTTPALNKEHLERARAAIAAGQPVSQ